MSFDMAFNREPLVTVLTLELVIVGLVRLHDVGPKLLLPDLLYICIPIRMTQKSPKNVG